MRKFNYSIILLGILLIPRISYAQFQNTNFATYGNYLQINPNANQNQVSVGVVKFSTSTPTLLPGARLHVNSYLLAPPLSGQFSLGELFRSDGDQSLTNAWRMYTGTSATAQSERISLFTGNGTTGGVLQDANLRANTGNLYVHAFGSQSSGGLKERMSVTSGITGNSARGRGNAD